jgi:hypothetical protein
MRGIHPTKEYVYSNFKLVVPAEINTWGELFESRRGIRIITNKSDVFVSCSEISWNNWNELISNNQEKAEGAISDIFWQRKQSFHELEVIREELSI